ncbi:MAG: hypothetical protein NTX66_02990 [Candidatus Falkowbacteria bacterium]|nr:hypothetical protein [Candidatus Falkowbacteria bacterium]
MDMQGLFKDAKNLTSYQIEKHFDEMLLHHPSYQYLSEENKRLILDLVHKYKEKVRTGVGVSGYTIREDNYHLYQNRLKLDLTPRDLETIKDILESFKTD